MTFEGFRKATPGEEDGYFHLSGMRESSRLSHHPFIVFNDEAVSLCDSPKKLITEYPPDADVLAQWGGQWRSDFFHFKVADLIAHIALIPKQDYHVI